LDERDHRETASVSSSPSCHLTPRTRTLGLRHYLRARERTTPTHQAEDVADFFIRRAAVGNRISSLHDHSPGRNQNHYPDDIGDLGGNAIVQCCPYISVDEEVDFICDMTKVRSFLYVHTFFMQHQQEYIRTRPQNPFMTASWLHLLLTQFHPFDVSDPLPFPDGFLLTTPSQGGNVRVARMIPSVPLVIAKYLMVNIDLGQRTEHYGGVRWVTGWMAHGGTLFMMSRLGSRGRSHTIDGMYCRRHAENPRTCARTVAHGLRCTCRLHSSTNAQRTQNADQERHASSLSPCLSMNLPPVCYLTCRRTAFCLA
jgi:hypothetical protein